MIKNKSKKLCSTVKNIMYNLQEFEFSQVFKTTSKAISKNNDINKNVHESIETKQYNSTNIPALKNKKKNKRIIFDHCRTFQTILEWRKAHIAPVDTMGCDRLSEPTMSEQIQKYQTLVALVLSIQTTDQITSMVVKRLQQHGLTPQNIANTSQVKLIELIYESNFNKRKAKNIIQVSKIILQKGLPKNQQQLVQLPGIGIKIAMIYLRSALGILNGIGVDTHVHRISNKLGWVQTNNPNETEQKLQLLFPQKYWTDLNVCLVGFGQILCNAKKPLCNECPVKLQCPSCLTKQKYIQW